MFFYLLCIYNQTLSEEEERIGVVDNNGDFKESSEPVEIIREEVVEVIENLNDETSLSSMEDQNEEEEDQKNEIKTDNRHSYNEAIYEQVKAQSIQLSKLTDMVESLQSQVKQLQETTRLRKRKTTSIRKKSTSNKGINTKKKTKRIGSTRSKKK
jgi:hypothetical protein